MALKFRSFALAALAVGMTAMAGYAAAAEPKKTYRWVDQDGVVHYGDRLPPEHSSANRQVLNEYGVPVSAEDGAKTPEQLAAEKAERERLEAERQKQVLAARRDQMLLDTYLTVEEIEALRDRRLELIDTQIKVTENYLDGLREILAKLQAEAKAYKPFSDNPDAPPIDERLARELSNTMDSIMLYEKTLSEARVRKGEVIGQFSSDIDRFRTLKGRMPSDD